MTAYVVEADGGSRRNPGPAAYGAVVLVADAVVRELAGALGVASNNVAEYRSLIAALEWIAAQPDAQAARVEVRMDSKLVVEQMSGRWKIKHPDVRELALRPAGHCPATRCATWVPRAANKRADALVNEVLDTGDEELLIDRAP